MNLFIALEKAKMLDGQVLIEISIMATSEVVIHNKDITRRHKARSHEFHQSKMTEEIIEMFWILHQLLMEHYVKGTWRQIQNIRISSEVKMTTLC